MICNFLIFDNQKLRFDPYMAYSGLHRRILLSQFFKKSKKSSKSPCFMAYFVPNFLLIIFLKTKKIYLVPPTQKNSKNCRKFAKNRTFWDSNSRRLEPKSKNREPIGAEYALDLSKSFNRSSLSFTWPKFCCTS